MAKIEIATSSSHFLIMSVHCVQKMPHFLSPRHPTPTEPSTAKKHHLATPRRVSCSASCEGEVVSEYIIREVSLAKAANQGDKFRLAREHHGISYGVFGVNTIRIRMFSFNLCSHRWFVIRSRGGKKQSNESGSCFGSIKKFSIRVILYDIIFLIVSDWFFISNLMIIVLIFFFKYYNSYWMIAVWC